MKKHILALCGICLSLVPLASVEAFWSYLPYADHQNITKAALSAPSQPFCFQTTTTNNCFNFSAAAVTQINAMHQIADDPVNYSPQNHFDSDSLVGSLQQLSARRNALNTFLGNAVQGTSLNAYTSQTSVWTTLGLMLHAIEDFYAHSSWVDEGNRNIIGFGALTAIPANPIIPASFTSSFQSTYCPTPAGYPLLPPVNYLITGFYPPALTPTGGCIHGNLVLIGNSCINSVETFGIGLAVPGISHDIPCAYLSSANTLHVVATQLAIQEVNSFLQAIVQDLNTAHNPSGFCVLLGLDPSTPICQEYSISVSVTGLPSGGDIVLADNGGDNLTVQAGNSPTASGTFATLLASGASYSVGVAAPPSGQGCTVTNGSGKVSNTNIVVAVSCANDYTVGVTVTGLPQGDVLTVKDNLGDVLTVANGVSSPFATRFPNTSAYSLSIGASPPGETCTLGTNANGTINGANVVVAIGCKASGGVSAAASVSAGESHACAVSGAGALYCWGANIAGEIGNGTSITPVTAPVEVTGIPGVISVSAGVYHTCAVDGNGGAWCWGNGASMGAGNSQSLNPLVPNKVVDAGGMNPLTGVAAVSSVGVAFSCALMQAGSVLCWGSNAQGQLGDDEAESASNIPKEVSNLSGVVAIATGWYHACALTNIGAVWCWGDDRFGELGDGNINSIAETPIQVPGLPADIVAITAGFYSTCALTGSGAVWCWGYDLYGEFGVGPPAVEYPSPQPVIGLASGAVAISTFAYHSCAQIGGGMQCWGNQGLGLGNNVVDDSVVPATVVDPAGTAPLTGVTQMSVGDGFTCAVLTGGGVDCWGLNTQGQIGNGTTNQLNSTAHSPPPSPVVGVGGTGFLQL